WGFRAVVRNRIILIIPASDARQFLPDRKAAGRHREDRRRICATQEGRSAELQRALPVPRRENAILLGSRGAPVLPLLRLRAVGRCLLLHSEDRKRQLS